MSIEYDNYLKQHRGNVYRAYEWIRDNIPEVLKPDEYYDYETQIMLDHDKSKNDAEEYRAYDRYFYGRNRSSYVVSDFNYAWLRHIHQNPHHWQYWVLINDDPDEGEICLDMPHNYIVEMICDWWAFSWAKGNLYEIFSWYEDHKDYMKLSEKTRDTVEDILTKTKDKLDTNKEDISNE